MKFGVARTKRVAATVVVGFRKSPSPFLTAFNTWSHTSLGKVGMSRLA